MATPPFNIAENTPADNGAVSGFPAQERAFRDIVEDALAVEHDMNTAGSSARHKFGRGSTASRDAITDWVVGSIWFNTDTSPAVLQTVTAVGPVVWENVNAPARGHIDGLRTKPGADSVEDYDVFPGECTNDTFLAGSVAPALMKLTSKLTKRFDSGWTLGDNGGALDVGSAIGTSLWYYVYLIRRPDTGVVDSLASLSPDDQRTATITIASPAVVTSVGNGFQNGAGLQFTTTGALPTGINPGVTYFVINANRTLGTFNIAATQGGAAINTSGSQSGVHTITGSPVMPTNYTQKRRIGAIKRVAGVNQPWIQHGDMFKWQANGGFNESTSTTNAAAQISPELVGFPIGLIVAPIFHIRLLKNDATPSNVAFSLGDGDIFSDVQARVATTIISSSDGSDNIDCVVPPVFWSDRRARVTFSRVVASGSLNSFDWDTNGWVDPRGRHNILEVGT